MNVTPTILQSYLYIFLITKNADNIYGKTAEML